MAQPQGLEPSAASAMASSFSTVRQLRAVQATFSVAGTAAASFDLQ
jgi:hypothetical protein